MRPSNNVITYRVSTARPALSLFSEAGWDETSHTVTILRHDPDDHSHDELFVDHVHIERRNWSWRYPDTDLVWGQGEGEEHLGGHLSLYGNHGQGVTSRGSVVSKVQVQRVAAMYKCRIAADAGATVDKTGVLSWDSDSDQWKKASWHDVLVFGYYSFEYQVHFAPADVTVCAFIDKRGSGSCWVPWTPPEEYLAPNLFKDVCKSKEPDSGSPGSYAFAFADLLLDFHLADGFDPDVDASADGGAIGSVFPKRMTVEFVNQLFMEFNGAMAIPGPNPSDPAKVYAVTGRSVNAMTSRLIGSYLVSQPSKPEKALFSVHQGKLIVDGQAHDQSELVGDTLSWTDLPADLADQTGLPATGSATFSGDGTHIITTSFGATGKRLPAAELHAAHRDLIHRQPRLARAMLASGVGGLKVDGLLTMKNFELHEVTEGGQKSSVYVDKVQAPTMTSYDKILRTFMTKDLRETYLSNAPVDLDDEERAISQKNAQFATFCKSLEVPYLVNVLAQGVAQDEYAKNLNAARARKFLSKHPAKCDEFSELVSTLYQHHWEKQFPQIREYLKDQNNDHDRDIDSIRQKWIAEIQAGAESIADPDHPQATINEQIKFIEELTTQAKTTRTYWAYMLYLYLTSNEQLQAYRLQISSPARRNMADSQSLALLLQTNNGVLNVLDPSGYFSRQYSEVMQMYNLSGIVSDWVDYGGNMDNFCYAAEEILKGYIKKYVNSLDPDIQKSVMDLQKEMSAANIQQIREAYMQALSQIGVQGSWGELMAIAQRDHFSKFGAGMSKLAMAFGFSLNITSIVMLVNGGVSFKDLSAETQARAIIGGIDALAHGMAFLLKGGTRAYFFLDRTASYWSQTKQLGRLLFIDEEVAQASINAFGNAGVRWISRGNEASSVVAMMSRTATTHILDDTPWTRVMGRSLDEFVAVRLGTVLAVANLIISAIQLSKDKNKYDKAVDGVFVAAAALDVIALTATWALSFMIAGTTGAMVVSAIASIAGPLALLASIIGIILVFVFQKEHDIIYRFLEDYARPKGYFMEGTSIDYFSINRTNDGKALPAGISLVTTQLVWESRIIDVPSGPDGGFTRETLYEPKISDTAKALTFQSSAQPAEDSFTHSWGNVLSLVVDEAGIANFIAITPDRKNRKLLALAVDQKTNGVVLQDLSAEGMNTEEQAKARQWDVTIISSDSGGGDDTLPSKARVLLRHKTSGKLLDTLGLKFVTDFSNPQTTYTPPSPVTDWPLWSLKRSVAAVGNITYEDLLICLDPADTSRNLQVGGALDIGQSGQEPYTWSLGAGWPTYLSLDEKRGTVSLKKDALPKKLSDAEFKAMAEKQYAITVGSKLEDGSAVSAPAQLKVQVRHISAPYEVRYGLPLLLKVGKKYDKPTLPGLVPYVTGTFSVAPALPGFLHLNSFNGSISMVDAPTALMTRQTFTVTLKNEFGEASGKIDIEVAAAA
ncbi:hypothetical protein [Caballeronia humi]|uniref:Uncharacterized protein n=1 Tax=Caballeronia humi TaxID=326474 RepID=A0A158G0F7_9BURK|nr:hypothetical protein [Caballeronia humi]SAL25423.1 hypothetical protein AWB65_01455 [Caballeronia humi]